MRILFDQNISHRVTKYLPKQYKESITVKSAGLTNASDLEIWAYCKSNGFTIVTQDSDFNEMATLKGPPPKVIWLRLGNATNEHIAQTMVNCERMIQNFLDSDAACLEIFNRA